MITYEEIRKKTFIPFCFGMLGMLLSLCVVVIGIIEIISPRLSFEIGIYLLLFGIFLLSLFYMYVFMYLKDKMVNG